MDEEKASEQEDSIIIIGYIERAYFRHNGDMLSLEIRNPYCFLSNPFKTFIDSSQNSLSEKTRIISLFSTFMSNKSYYESNMFDCFECNDIAFEHLDDLEFFLDNRLYEHLMVIRDNSTEEHNSSNRNIVL